MIIFYSNQLCIYKLSGQEHDSNYNHLYLMTLIIILVGPKYILK